MLKKYPYLTGLLAVLLAAVLGISWVAKDSAWGVDDAAGPSSRNGQIPVEELVAVGGGRYLLADAAQAYRETIAALERAGHSAELNSAYRSLAEQQEMIDRYGLLADGGRAAPLGTSEHGEGIAVDLRVDWEALVWLREHAHEFGFAETIEDEPWHWAHTG